MVGMKDSDLGEAWLPLVDGPARDAWLAILASSYRNKQNVQEG